MNRKFSDVFAISILFLQGWGSTPAAASLPVESRSQSEAFTTGTHLQKIEQEDKDFHEIEGLFSKNAIAEAHSEISQFLRKYPKSALLPSIENLRGLLYLKTKNYPLALYHFRRAIDLNPGNQKFNQYILYNLASVQLSSNQIEESQRTVDEISPDLLDLENRTKLYFLKANIYERKGLPEEAIRQLFSLRRIISDSDIKESAETFYKILDRSLKSINDVPLLQRLYQEFENSPAADALLFRLGSRELALGNSGSGESHLRTLVSKFRLSSYYAQSVELLSTLKTQTTVESRSVGILLPMKGKLAKFGARSLQGIEMAFGTFNPQDPDSKIDLVIEDSGEETDQTIQALNRLVLKHHVVAVLGPMMSKGIEQVSQRAQELGIPLISLARRSGAGTSQDYIFQGGLTQQMQAYEVARYAIQRLGFHKFAVIFPKDKFGQEISQNFWDAVESMGGKMTAAESYNPNETDFRQTVDKVAGLYYTEARKRELDLLAQEREANNIKKRTRKTEQFFNLKPIVDFDAVFIPDEPKVAGQLIPTFAYRDVEKIKFLGTSSWNSPDFLSRLQSYADHATFVDAYFAESKSPRIRSFIEKYKSTFGQDPTPLEALAYDSGMILKNILSSTDLALSRSEIRDRLKKVSDFEGVTGNISSQNGQFRRNLKVITVKSNQFTEVQ